MQVVFERRMPHNSTLHKTPKSVPVFKESRGLTAPDRCVVVKVSAKIEILEEDG